jgi:AcrR family transcriptional regulator
VPAAAAPRWTRLEHDERREQILAAAGRLFSERRYGAVSTTAIAQEAGVARGLLNHYFGTKRDLYLEVVRAMVRVPPPPLPAETAGRSREDLVDESIGRWLTLQQRNRATWLASVGGEGFGSDPELQQILDEARDLAVDRLMVVLGHDPATASRELRAVLHGYGALAERTALQWLRHRRLTREQVHAVLVSTLLHLTTTVETDIRETKR